jgi:hypothetical protein
VTHSDGSLDSNRRRCRQDGKRRRRCRSSARASSTISVSHHVVEPTAVLWLVTSRCRPTRMVPPSSRDDPLKRMGSAAPEGHAATLAAVVRIVRGIAGAMRAGCQPARSSKEAHARRSRRGRGSQSRRRSLAYQLAKHSAPALCPLQRTDAGQTPREHDHQASEILMCFRGRNGSSMFTAGRKSERQRTVRPCRP